VKRGAAALLAGDIDLPSADEVQAHTRPGSVAAAEVAIEDECQVTGRVADAVVGDTDDDAALFQARIDLDVTFPGEST
jgi:hypothetical protein